MVAASKIPQHSALHSVRLGEQRLGEVLAEGFGGGIHQLLNWSGADEGQDVLGYFSGRLVEDHCCRWAVESSGFL